MVIARLWAICQSHDTGVDVFVNTDGLSLGRTCYDDPRLQKVLIFWKGVSEYLSEAGETHRGLLEGLKAELDDVLSREPVDLNRIDSLTAEAAIILCGRKLF